MSAGGRLPEASVLQRAPERGTEVGVPVFCFNTSPHWHSISFLQVRDVEVWVGFW